MVSVRSDQEESFYFGNQFPQHGAQVVPDSSQQDAEQGDPHQRVEDAEQLPPLCLRGGAPKTWTQPTRGAQESVLILKRPKKSPRFDSPIVVMIVPEKKKALARSHWLMKVMLLLGSTPAPMASTTS